MGNFSSLSCGTPDSTNNADGVYAGRQPVPFSSKDEMVMWLGDKRYRGGIYQRDSEYANHCEARLILTDDKITGANRDLSVSDHAPEYQDPLNTLGGMNDVYRDMSEARRDQAAPLYKESAFERQRVAEKIDRSVPDEVVHVGKQAYSVQTGGEDEGEEQ